MVELKHVNVGPFPIRNIWRTIRDFERWQGLKSLVMIESERIIGEKTGKTNQLLYHQPGE